jgi:hypothetical protein
MSRTLFSKLFGKLFSEAHRACSEGGKQPVGDKIITIGKRCGAAWRVVGMR